ncbi:dynactin subunit, putative [Candida dubliniensis CD36]|uniref:Dynactin subunit 5 n=1 Tax=Candida dubliniensis (strain CD36 / ATCC MYA-646 / CBS 7987 / NCPF 3949 / NRRL Y-17841) TaxID=573826 RepID=B9WCM8_CANDC|nr:dynactin subunit, putative [Candida dubliniensis CD36]CAX44151.1 dynactin subunit, putative [Candida dubliniensis CD36]
MSDWIETPTENRISKDAQIEDLDNVVMSGNVTINRNVKISFDSLTTSSSPILSIGKYCYIYPDVEIIPSTEKMFIGSYVIIGNSSKIMAKDIGNRVIIEENCVLHSHCVVYDCCLIKSGTVIPHKVVIPPYSKVSGTPGIDFVIQSLHNSYKKTIELEAKQLQILNPS